MTARAKTGVDDPAALAPSTAVSYLLALFDYLRLRQIDATELQRSLNVDLNDRDARVSELEAAELFNRAAVLAQDPDLGVHVAEHIRPGHYGVLGYVAMACTTLGEAMLAQQRYQGLVITVAPDAVWRTSIFSVCPSSWLCTRLAACTACSKPRCASASAR